MFQSGQTQKFQNTETMKKQTGLVGWITLLPVLPPVSLAVMATN
jgi:hypothetical protein